MTSSVISADPIDFSRFSRLVRSFAWVRRSCWSLRSSDRRKGSLSSNEVKETEIEILRLPQSGLSGDRMKELEASLKVELNKEGLIVKVGMFEEFWCHVEVISQNLLSLMHTLRQNILEQLLPWQSCVPDLGIIKGSCFVCSKAQSKPFQSVKDLFPNFECQAKLNILKTLALITWDLFT